MCAFGFCERLASCIRVKFTKSDNNHIRKYLGSSKRALKALILDIRFLLDIPSQLNGSPSFLINLSHSSLPHSLSFNTIFHFQASKQTNNKRQYSCAKVRDHPFIYYPLFFLSFGFGCVCVACKQDSACPEIEA